MLKEPEKEDGHGSVEDGVTRQVETVIERLSAEIVEEGEEDLSGEDGHVLVEEVLHQHRHAVVIPELKVCLLV